MFDKYIPLSEPGCYILQSIYAKPKHGYAIVQDIKKMSEGTIMLSNGTLYGILKRMETDGLLKTKSTDEKKIYYLTPRGEEILTQEFKRINKIVENFKKINFGEG